MNFCWFIYIVFGLSFYINSACGLNRNDLYFYQNENSDVLPRGDEKFAFVKLSTPVHLFSETYDHVYVNTNGILTFRMELTNYMNIPFPLDNAGIAPFYANVDTSNSNDSTLITYFESNDPELLGNVSDLIKDNFVEAYDFEARSVFVATWENVGHFNRNNDRQNTFQVALITADGETYVHFLYPRNSINWIQADIGESGLPDVRAQAGFVSEDGRYYLIQTSATENIKYLPEGTNHGTPGSWLFRVGLVGYDGVVEQPDIDRDVEKEWPVSCNDGGRYKCHSKARCKDYDTGFCCLCTEGYYGNGLSCIRNDVPLRVNGNIKARIGSEQMEAQIQSYVVLTDARSYTAITPIDESIGYQFQLLSILGESIGWLFAKPADDYINGYQLTGGKFNRSSTIFFESGELLNINQMFTGLNHYDQLNVNVWINGELPLIGSGTKFQVNDVIFQYSLQTSPSFRHTTLRKFNFGENKTLTYTVDETTQFEPCPHSSFTVNEGEQREIHEKITKITTSYDPNEKALRISMINKVGNQEQLSPCASQRNCGPNTYCSFDAEYDEDYQCLCLHGYTPAQPDENGIEYCVDIDECYGENICDPNSDCTNTPGGYNCRCQTGYSGNGYICKLIDQRFDENIDHNDVDEKTQINYTQEAALINNETDDQQNNVRISEEKYDFVSVDSNSELTQHNSYSETPGFTDTYSPISEVLEVQTNETAAIDRMEVCQHCSDFADCIDGECVCRSGFEGNGEQCHCDDNNVWDGQNCVALFPEAEEELKPYCTQHGCTCPNGYELIEFAFEQICRFNQYYEERHNPEERPSNKIACNIENNCGPNASCEWIETQYICVCNPRFEGDGYECIETEVSCLFDDICDEHASCQYDPVIQKSVCKCNEKYEGDGKICQLAPECLIDDDCSGAHSFCDKGVCLCQDGFERDISDFCVPTGSCGGAYCAENAICKWDDHHGVPYCHCPEGFTGDGVAICKSIPPQCNIRNNCGLYASCTQNYRDTSKFECVCQEGYFGDGFVCTPEENCINIPSLCDSNAKCHSTVSGLRCICNEGFIGNGFNCSEILKVDSGFLLISQGPIIRIPIDGKRGLPVTMSHMAIGLDKDCAGSRFYWSDITTKSIWSANYDGSDKKAFITDNIISPEGVAVDWISRRLYWTDSTKDTVEVADLDNSTRRTVIVNKHLVNPRGIAVDPVQNKIYWSDWNREEPKIEWANLDGTDRQVLLSAPTVQLPNSLAIKHQTGELCFADAGTKNIDCVYGHSRDVRTVAANLSYPFGLAVSEDHYYWTDWQTKQIESIDIWGKRKPGRTGPLFGKHKLYGMTSVTEGCPIFHTQCFNNGECPPNRICLNNYNAPSGRSCKCILSQNCNDVVVDD